MNDLISRQAALKKLAVYIHLIDKTMGKGTLTDDDCMEAAIRHIQTATDVDPWAAEIAVEAMRKQIPQRPVIGYAFPDKIREVMKRIDPEKAETKTDCCPVCGRTLGVSKYVQTQSGLRFGDPHCKRCGQAIDWEGEG